MAFDAEFDSLLERFDSALGNGSVEAERAYEALSQAVSERIGTLPAFDARRAQKRLNECLARLQATNAQKNLEKPSRKLFHRYRNIETVRILKGFCAL